MYLLKMAKRMVLETDKRLLWKLAWNMGFKGMLSVERHKRCLKHGEAIPPFLHVSIINSGNPKRRRQSQGMGCPATIVSRTPVSEALF